MKVRIHNILSKKVKMKNGIPQNLVLSVLLFSISINEALVIIEPPLNRRLFIDDYTLAFRGKNYSLTFKIMQETSNKLQEWAESSGIKFSALKSEFMIVNRGHKSKENLELKLFGQIIKNVYAMKILGLTFDSQLTWNPHIKSLKTNC